MATTTAAVFNTLDLSRKLRASGFTAEQAEGLADALSKDVVTELATKTDLRELGHTLTIRLGGMLAVVAGLIVGAIKLL